MINLDEAERGLFYINPYLRSCLIKKTRHKVRFSKRHGIQWIPEIIHGYSRHNTSHSFGFIWLNFSVWHTENYSWNLPDGNFVWGTL